MYFQNPPAPLLLIGGTPDGVLPGELLTTFLNLAGGADAHLAIITSGSRVPLKIGPRYEQFFAPHCAEVKVFNLLSRADANDLTCLEGLDRATGVFFSGGEQLLTTTRLGGTLALDIIRERHTAGAVLSGTSAGASVMSGTMIGFGEEGETPRHAALTLAPGFGFLPQVVVDQHFSQRNRMGRLTTAMLYNPEQLGVGIDENSAILIRSDGTLTALGAANVTLIDGSQLETTDAADVEPLDVPLSSRGLRVSRLSAGAVFDLHTRRLR